MIQSTVPTSETAKSKSITISPARLRLLAMSFISALMLIFSLTAATRLPFYWGLEQYGQTVAIVLFNVFTLAMAGDNLLSHFRLHKN